MSNLYNRLNGHRPAYISYESDKEEEELLRDDDLYNKTVSYPIVIGSQKPINILDRYPILINLKRYFVTPYVYSRLICEKYLYNFSENNDISNINDFIYIGNQSTSTNKDLLKQHGITHILTILSSFNPSFPNDFIYNHINAYDDLNEDMTFKFQLSNTFIREAEKSGGKIYIHCMCGVSRSVTVALAYLLFKRQIENAKLKQYDIIDKRIKERATYLYDDCYKKLLASDNIYTGLCNDLIYELVNIIKKRPISNPNRSFLYQLNEYHLKSC
jgi:hypothetical protein